jgi:hypothetical protein
MWTKRGPGGPAALINRRCPNTPRMPRWHVRSMYHPPSPATLRPSWLHYLCGRGNEWRRSCSAWASAGRVSTRSSRPPTRSALPPWSSPEQPSHFIAVQGTRLTRLGSGSASVEMDRLRQAAKIIKQAEVEADKDPELAEGMIEAAAIISPELAESPQQQALRYEDRVHQALLRTQADRQLLPRSIRNQRDLSGMVLARDRS